MNSTKNILICPLEWGLGHAARMIPIARELQERNCRVFIGAGEKHSSLFRAELTGLTFIHFPGFNPGYSRHLPQYLAMLFKTPLLLFRIVMEHRRLRQIITQHCIDIVISDNRFGLWNNSIVSVYVTHMPRIPLPFPWKPLERIGIYLHRWIIRKYDYCMIPDLPGDNNLSGKLSHNLRLPDNTRFTGIISRFDRIIQNTGNYAFSHNTIILSGPEPQRSILKRKLSQALKDNPVTTIILEGKPDIKNRKEGEGNIILYSHLPASEMKELLVTSNFIVSRSGYTTIMDLVYINCTGLLIPTPGQTEQEYLADYLAGKGWFDTINQKEIDRGITVERLKPSWPDSMVEESRALLKDFLTDLLEEKQE